MDRSEVFMIVNAQSPEAFKDLQPYGDIHRTGTQYDIVTTEQKYKEKFAAIKVEEFSSRKAAFVQLDILVRQGA